MLRQVLNRVRRFIRGGKLNQCVGPKAAGIQLSMYMLADLRVKNIEKALGVLCVFIDDVVAQVKNIHGISLLGYIGVVDMSTCSGRKIGWKAVQDM